MTRVSSYVSKGTKRWWHFVLPRRFWYCYVLGGGPPSKKHTSKFLAEQEAVRLADSIGLPVYVLAATDVFLPRQPAPAPAIAQHGYDYGREVAWFNGPDDVEVVF